MKLISKRPDVPAGKSKSAALLPCPVFLFLLMLSAAGCTDVPKTAAVDPSVPYTEVDGYKFHTEIHGKGDLPVVIVVHGGPGADFSYLRSLSALSNEYRIVFYDQRGTGLSPRETAGDYTIEGFINDLDSMVKAYSNNSPVRLIGHSWGGMLVTAYISRHPERVSHALIAEPGMLNTEAAKALVGKLKENESFTDTLKMLPYLAASLFVKSADGHEGKDFVMTRIIGSAKGAPYLCEGEALPPASISRAGFSSFKSMMMPIMKNPGMFEYDLAKGIERYKGKTLLLSSECSFIGYMFQEKYHVPLLPRSARHIKMEKTGHYMITTKTEESLGIIREFLR